MTKFWFDGINSVDLSIGSNENSSMNEESLEDVGEHETVDNTINETVNNTVNETGDNVTATPDVTSVLEKLKTLNSQDIK